MAYQELETILTEVEGNLNNRPLTYEYKQVGEEVLNPNHLLYGQRLGTLPDETINGEDDDLKMEAGISGKFTQIP